MSFCHKLWFPYLYFFVTQCRRPSSRSNNPSLKYQRFALSGCKDIGIRRFKFVTKIQFLSSLNGGLKLLLCRVFVWFGWSCRVGYRTWCSKLDCKPRRLGKDDLIILRPAHPPAPLPLLRVYALHKHAMVFILVFLVFALKFKHWDSMHGP